MDQSIRKELDNLHNSDAHSRYGSFQNLIAITTPTVDWAYEVWEELLTLTVNGDNHQRTMAVQLLSNLAKSDPDQKLLHDLDSLLVVTKDEKFVTARHSLQSLWKVGIASDALKKQVVDKLSSRFRECMTEKNCTLIRYDILQVFKKIYDKLPDEDFIKKMATLISSEEDAKYRKKYAGLWKGLLPYTGLIP